MGIDEYYEKIITILKGDSYKDENIKENELDKWLYLFVKTLVAKYDNFPYKESFKFLQRMQEKHGKDFSRCVRKCDCKGGLQEGYMFPYVWEKTVEGYDEYKRELETMDISAILTNVYKVLN